MLRPLGKGDGKGMMRRNRKGEGKGSGKGEANLSGRGFDDASISKWCERLTSTTGLGLASINMSNNELTDAAASTLASALLEGGTPVRILKLFSNRIGDGGAISLARLITDAQCPVGELHLSHNAIQHAGAEALLLAGAGAKDKTGGPRYPSFETTSSSQPVPLWLRLEYNVIDDGQSFQVEMEQKLLALRISKGFLDEGKKVPMICEALEGYGCSSRGCSLLCPGGLAGMVGGPVVHAPHLRKQRRLCELPAPSVISGARSGAPVPLPGGSQLPGVPARYFIGDEGAERRSEAMKQCRFADVRLGEAALRDQGAAAAPIVSPKCAARAPAREATPEPRQQPAALASAGTPPKPGPVAGASPTAPCSLKVGETVKVARQVTEKDAEASGFAPETYLHPLQPGEEVRAMHVCEGDEAGWIWAERVAGPKTTGGWLSLDALLVPAAGACGGS